jgi:F-type H+-transporting ATPase subunit delta
LQPLFRIPTSPSPNAPQRVIAAPCGLARSCQATPIREQKHVGQDGVDLSGVAGRYAFALYELASEQRATDEVSRSLAAFQRLLGDSADLRRLVASPVFSAADQAKALNAVLNAAGIAGVAANFIRLVATKRRLFALPDMISAFQRLDERAKGLVRAEAVVAAPLRPEHESALRQALSAATGGKTINLNVKTDPSIVGGIIVKLGSRMVDASVKTKLNAIRTRMKEVG